MPPPRKPLLFLGGGSWGVLWYSTMSLFIFLFREQPAYVVEQLSDRVLVRVTGTEASTFLQGLITNDMDHLKEDDSRSTIVSDAYSAC